VIVLKLARRVSEKPECSPIVIALPIAPQDDC
jgi:hypothetical protein